MKRFVILLALFALFLSAAVTFDLWYPWLWATLGDSTTSDAIQAFEALLGIAFYAATIALGIATYLGWRAKSLNPEPVQAQKLESDPEQRQDPADEPTPPARDRPGVGR